MNSSLPLRNLHRITLLMTILINIFVLVILVISKASTPAFIAGTFVRSFIVIYLLGLTNILTLRFVQSKYIQLLKQINLVRNTLSTVSCLTVYVLLVMIFSFMQGKENELLDQTKIIPQLIAFVIFHTLIVVLHDQVVLQHTKTQAELENIQLKASVIEASNFLLRQQIHPHFLFNSLTILKSLYKKDVVKGEFYLTRLANFLRASISDHSSKVTTLQTELMMCLDYMEMQKIRFGAAIEYNVFVTEAAKNRFVPFFSIQVLLENAIKHNAMTDENPLKIDVTENTGYITVANNLQMKSNKEISTGQGLANLAERYKLLSGDLISIKQDMKTFSITIKMYENENFDSGLRDGSSTNFAL